MRLSELELMTTGELLRVRPVIREREKIIAALKTVYDPEIPVDIYELGLIYEICIADDLAVKIRMTARIRMDAGTILRSRLVADGAQRPARSKANAAATPRVSMAVNRRKAARQNRTRRRLCRTAARARATAGASSRKICARASARP